MTGRAMPAARRTPVRSSPRNRSRLVAALACGQLAAVLVCLAGLLLQPNLDPYALHVAIVAAGAWTLVSWRLTGGELLSPYAAFTFSLLFFLAGQSALEALGLNQQGYLGGRYDDGIVLFTLWCVLLAILSGHLGALLGSVRRRLPVRAPGPMHEARSLRALRMVGRLMLALSIPPAIVTLWAARAAVLDGGYMSLYQVNQGTGLSAAPLILASLLVPGALFVHAGSRAGSRERRFAVAMIVGYAAVQMFLGFRINGAMPLVAYFYLRHRLVKPVGMTLSVAVAAMLMLVVFPAVKEFRLSAGAERSSIEFLQEAYLSIENPAVAILDELGGTARVLADTVALVPQARPFDSGATYGYALLTLFPNLFWDVHPTIARGTASDWLIWTVDPIWAREGGGLGFSAVAEAYLNFGVPGIAVSMVLFGFFLARLDLWGNSPARVAMVATLLAFILRWPRDESASMVRPAFWFAIAPYLAVLALRSFEANHAFRWTTARAPLLRAGGRTTPPATAQGL